MSRIVAMVCERELLWDENRCIHIIVPERVTIVDTYGKVLLDEYVKPTPTVTELPDYRYRNSCYSAIKKHRLKNGTDLSVVRNKVANLIKGCILVGHGLHFVFEALNLSHPESDCRDLACKLQPWFMGWRWMSLKTLAYLKLDRDIPECDSVEHAKACMELHRKYPDFYKK